MTVTLVTGANSGLGRATALLLAQKGHKVYAGMRDLDKGSKLLDLAEDYDLSTIEIDVTNNDSVVGCADQIEANGDALDVLVNNAGVHGPRGRLDELTNYEIQAVLNTNVLGCFLCARAAVKRMSTKHGGGGGAIVNVSSGSAHLGAPNDGILYAASKGAVNSLTIGLSQEVAREGIRVNTVAPGLTETDMPSKEALEHMGPQLPAGRVGQPEEIGEAIVWLLSDAASYVNGANLRVSGGRI